MSWNELLERFEPRLMIFEPVWRGQDLIDMQIKASTESAAHWFGDKIDALVDRSVLDVMPNLFTASSLRLLGDLIDKTPVQTELAWLDPQASSQTYIVLEAVQIDEAIQIQWMSRTTRHRASWQQTQASALNDLMRNILELIPSPIFVKDEDHRWILGNKAFGDLLGLGVDEFTGRSDYDFFPKEQADIFWEKDEEVMRGNKAVINEEALTDSQNRQRWILTHKTPIDLGNNQTGLLGIITDITARKLTEQQLVHEMEARKHLMAINETKSRFMARMSHELRTPLNAIIGYAELIEEELPEVEHFDEVVPDLKNIQDAAQHLYMLINDVLDLSKIERGQLTLHPAEIDIQATLLEVATMVQPLAQQHHCAVDIGLNAAGQMTTDLGRFKQIVVNVLNHAIVASHGNLDFQAQTTEEDLIITIDTPGPTLSLKAQDHLFVPFESVDQEGKPLLEGVGMTLSLARQLCHALGGDISVSCPMGQSTRLTIKLPRTWEAPSLDRRDIFSQHTTQSLLNRFAQYAQDGQQTILIVERNTHTLEFLQHVVPEERICLHWCASLEQARAQVAEHAPDLMLVDRQLALDWTPDPELNILWMDHTRQDAHDLVRPIGRTQWKTIEKHLSHH